MEQEQLKKQLKNARFFLPLILLTVSVTLSAADFPRLTPEDQMFTIRESREKMTGERLLRYGLFLSETEEKKIPGYLEIYREKVEKFRNTEANTNESSYRLGEELLFFLHEELFKRYDEYQTEVDVLFDTGVHNCVTSAVVYSAFALEFGLTVESVNTADHVFCAVTTEKGKIDVETTTPYGFHPGIKREFTDSFGKTGYTYIPPGNYAQRNQGDLITLLSFILQNRIARMQRRGNYFDSVGLAVDRYALLGTVKAYNEMILEFINYAALLNREKRYLEALDFLNRVDDRYATEDRFDELYDTLTNNAVVLLADTGDYRRTEELIRSWAEAGIIDREQSVELFGILYDKELYNAVHSFGHREAVSMADDFYSGGKIARKRYEEFIVFLFGKKAEELARRRKWLEAAEAAAEGLAKLGSSRQLERAVEGYKNNFAVSVHNEFAQLYNRKRYAEAKALVEEGLEKLPENPILLKDLETVSRTLEGS